MLQLIYNKNQQHNHPCKHVPLTCPLTNDLSAVTSFQETLVLSVKRLYDTQLHVNELMESGNTNNKYSKGKPDVFGFQQIPNPWNNVLNRRITIAEISQPL